MLLLRSIKVASKFCQDLPLCLCVFVKVGHWRLEISRIRKAIGAYRPKLREGEVSLVQLKNVSSHRALRKRDAVSNTTRYDTNLVGAYNKAAQLGLNIQHTVLGDDEKVTISRVECFIGLHILSCSVYKVPDSRLHCGVTGTSHQVQRVHPVYRLVEVEGIPSELVWDIVYPLPWFVLRICVERFRFTGLKVTVAARWQDTIEPCLLVLVPRGCEGGSRKLLSVEPVRGLLW